MFYSNSRYSDSSDVNLNVGIAASVTDTIVQHINRLTVRNTINNKQIDGNIFKDVINDAKKIYTGSCFKNGEVGLSKVLLDGFLNRQHLKEELIIEKA